jgi:2-amino-4-hydroxy-6-hydroxymethyldihydropteridine diphosphokinase
VKTKRGRRKRVNAYIALGSNLGDKEKNIRRAIGLLEEKCKVLETSPLYKTEPVGYKNQDWFLNCVVEIETGFEPKALLLFLKTIEKKLGRKKTINNGPRTIDLDILFYEDKVINEKDLTIPHPRLHERLFVLKPLYDLCPDFIHPSLNKSVKETLSDLDDKKEKVEVYNLNAEKLDTS